MQNFISSVNNLIVKCEVSIFSSSNIWSFWKSLITILQTNFKHASNYIASSFHIIQDVYREKYIMVKYDGVSI